MLTGSSFWVTGQVTACVHQMGRLYRHQGSLQSTGCMIDTRSHVKCHTCALPWTLSQSIDRPSTSLREEAGSSGNLTAGGKDKEGGGKQPDGSSVSGSDYEEGYYYDMSEGEEERGALEDAELRDAMLASKLDHIAAGTML